MKSFFTLSILLLLSAVSSAEVIAKAAAVCLGVEKKELIRTVYLTSDKNVLVADPIGYLVKVDQVERVSDSTLKITYSFPESQETLMIYNQGVGEVIMKNSAGEQKFAVKCYSNKEPASAEVLE